MTLWDFYASCEGGLSGGFAVMHVYVCGAFLQRFRQDLLLLEFPGIYFLLPVSTYTLLFLN